jgi:peptidyl-prolyl cis-trans isomerase SurA
MERADFPWYEPRRMRARLLCSALTLAAASLAFAPPAEAVVVERVVAVVGDRPILLSQLRNRAKPFLRQIQSKVPAGAQQAAAESQVLKDLVEKMVDEELEAQAAEKAKITVTPEEVDTAFRNVAASQRITVQALFREALTKSGLSEQEYRDEIRRQLLEGKMLQLRVKGRVRITEEDVKVMYEKVRREERKRREFHPAWIVLRIIPGSSPQAVEERYALATQITDRARKGEDFAILAQQYSDDTQTRETGGDLGIRSTQVMAAQGGRRAVMSPELERVLMEMEPGQVSPPQRAGDAVVIMKLLSRQPSRYTTLDAAKNEMLQRLQTEILEKAKRKWLEELKQRTHLDVRF